MLLQLGQRHSGTDVVDLLDECHGRIRRFLDQAGRLASVGDADAVTVAEAAGQIRRYFLEAFPLHLADEDELVFPMLFGQADTVDDALARMHADHREHAPFVAALVDVCADLQARPRRLVASATQLASVTAALREVLEPHLTLEEREIFPALRALPEAKRAAIKQGMQRRREAALVSATQDLRR